MASASGGMGAWVNKSVIFTLNADQYPLGLYLVRTPELSIGAPVPWTPCAHFFRQIAALEIRFVRLIVALPPIVAQYAPHAGEHSLRGMEQNFDVCKGCGKHFCSRCRSGSPKTPIVCSHPSAVAG